jgi:DNA-binding transcriptional regulator YiaG
MSSTATLKYADRSSYEQRNAGTLQAHMALKPEEIAGRIKHLRERSGLPPQPVVAAGIPVALRTLQKWEAGGAIPRHGNLTALAAYYEVSEEWILTGVENAVPESPVLVSRNVDEVSERFERHVQNMRADLAKVLRNQVLLMRALGVREEASSGQPVVPYPEAEAPPAEDRRRANGGDRRGTGTRRR